MNMKRNLPGNKVYDPSAVENNAYSDKAGAHKVAEVGRRLTGIPKAGSWVTDASAAAVALPSAGKNLAIYNNAGVVGSVTLGGATVASLAPGAVDANGKVGIPCAPNSWTYVAAGEDTFVITSANTLLVFLIDDESFLTPDNAN